MLREAVGVFELFALLTGIGIGPALWLVAGERRLAYAAGVAPALGYAIIGLLAFPLVRYVGPTERWALPVTAVLLAISLGLAAQAWRRHGDEYRWPGWPSTVLVGAWIATWCLVLLAPLILVGMQYGAFRSNPSDAFLMISLAESMRAVEWKTILEGANFAQTNAENVRRLGEASPTALLAARAILRPVGLNTPAAVAWAASIVGRPIYRFYHVHHLISLALSIPLVLAIGDTLRLWRLIKYLAAGAVACGFWAKFVLESDAGYEIAAIPLMLLAVFAWILLEQEPRHPMWRSRLLLALALATLVTFYFPLVPVLALGFACYYGWGWLQRVRPVSAGLWHGATVALVLLVLLISGQLDLAWSATKYLITSAAGEARYPPFVVSLITRNDVSAVWGLPGSFFWSGIASPNGRWLLQSLTDALGAYLTAALAITAVFVARRSAPVPERIVFAVFVGGLVLGFVEGALDNLRATGKAFTYVYPYLVLSVAIFPHYASDILKRPWQGLATALIAVWLATQGALGFVLPYDGRMLKEQYGAIKEGDYDLSPITEQLDVLRPNELLVMIPRAGVYRKNTKDEPHNPKGWTFAYYAMLAFAPYEPYYQSGLMVDNSYQPQNLWVEHMTHAPDYAVVLKAVDYIGPGGLGTRLAETPELVLYRVTSDDVTVFQEAERRIYGQRERETECLEGLCSPPGS